MKMLSDFLSMYRAHKIFVNKLTGLWICNNFLNISHVFVDKL